VDLTCLMNWFPDLSFDEKYPKKLAESLKRLDLILEKVVQYPLEAMVVSTTPGPEHLREYLPVVYRCRWLSRRFAVLCFCAEAAFILYCGFSGSHCLWHHPSVLPQRSLCFLWPAVPFCPDHARYGLFYPAHADHRGGCVRFPDLLDLHRVFHRAVPHLLLSDAVVSGILGRHMVGTDGIFPVHLEKTAEACLSCSGATGYRHLKADWMRELHTII